ncbi:MAG: hypothetical protein PHQ36_03865 [Anaerolineales bacterium]|nr:hypothetical protein [Anaerolineales bacterium]
MTSKNLTQIANRFIASALLAILFCAFIVPVQVYAKSASPSLPSLNAFVTIVKNGEASTLRGVYVPNVMAYSIVQQPEKDAGFVSTEKSAVTQFNMAAKAGNVGLLAHSYLAGKSFPSIKQGDQIVLVYGDGRTETFVAESILQYQKLPYGLYKDLKTQNNLGTGELFDAVYGGAYHLALQTCIESGGDAEWGRLFIIAKPIQ